MDKNLCPVGLPGPMRDALWSRICDRKNRHTAMTFVDWLFCVGLLFRTKNGFGLVRGSNRKIATGLKERADLQELGLTADKIRGATELLVKVGFLDVEVAEDTGWHMNFRGQPRRAANTYRLSAEFRSIYYRACESGAAVRHWAKKTAIAAKHVALRLCSSVEANLTHSETLSSFSPEVSQTLQDRATSRGDLGISGPPKLRLIPPVSTSPVLCPAELPDRPLKPDAEPRPNLAPVQELSEFDRQMMARNAAVMRHVEGVHTDQPAVPDILRRATVTDDRRSPGSESMQVEPETFRSEDEFDRIVARYGIPARKPQPDGGPP